MSIMIDSEKCIGCGRCAEVCPGNLIVMDNKAYMKYPKDCWGCTSCIKECSAGAVKFFLGADMGGRGSLVYTRQQGNILTWVMECPDGSVKEIQINRKESNRY